MTGDTGGFESSEPSKLILAPFDLTTGELLFETDGLVPLVDTYEFTNGLISAGEVAMGALPLSTYVSPPGHEPAGVYVYGGPTDRFGPLLSATTSLVSSDTLPSRVAHGDIDADGVAEVIVARAVEGSPVWVLGQDGAVRATFDSFEGVTATRVTAADVDGDGADEVIALDGTTLGGHVMVFDGVTGLVRADFFALELLDPGIGVSVAGQDIDGDGTDEVFVGGVVQGQPKLYASRVNVGTGTATPLWSIGGPTLAGRPPLQAGDYVVLRGPDLPIVPGFGTVPTLVELVCDPVSGVGTVRILDPAAVTTEPTVYTWEVRPDFMPFGPQTRYTGHVTWADTWSSLDLVAWRGGPPQ